MEAGITLKEETIQGTGASTTLRFHVLNRTKTTSSDNDRGLNKHDKSRLPPFTTKKATQQATQLFDGWDTTRRLIPFQHPKKLKTAKKGRECQEKS